MQWKTKYFQFVQVPKHEKASKGSKEGIQGGGMQPFTHPLRSKACSGLHASAASAAKSSIEHLLGCLVENCDSEGRDSRNLKNLKKESLRKET